MQNFNVPFTDITVIFAKNTYTVAEGDEVEVCIETRGVSERGYVTLNMQTTLGSKIFLQLVQNKSATYTHTLFFSLFFRFQQFWLLRFWSSDTRRGEHISKMYDISCCGWWSTRRNGVFQSHYFFCWWVRWHCSTQLSQGLRYWQWYVIVCRYCHTLGHEGLIVRFIGANPQ